MFICGFVALTIVTVTYGVVTGFNYLNFCPIFFAEIMLIIVLLYELGIYQDKISLKQTIFLNSTKITVGLMQTFSMMYSLIYNLPFNNVVYLFLAIFVIVLLSFWMVCLSNDYKVPKFLKPFEKLQISQQKDPSSNLSPKQRINRRKQQQQQVATKKKIPRKIMTNGEFTQNDFGQVL
eukprot:TRINITY_DN8653_c1_g2_i1.p1 TRINITY_DN8653_c1_g2~~TRINITY_DN8653_c1_g2_i1.p1  ORF type:complete len:178 (-),score=8.20 TRINITY_DN8653_c1_g2_i1:95-628(-)